MQTGKPACVEYRSICCPTYDMHAEEMYQHIPRVPLSWWEVPSDVQSRLWSRIIELIYPLPARLHEYRLARLGRSAYQAHVVEVDLSTAGVNMLMSVATSDTTETQENPGHDETLKQARSNWHRGAAIFTVTPHVSPLHQLRHRLLKPIGMIFRGSRAQVVPYFFETTVHEDSGKIPARVVEDIVNAGRLLTLFTVKFFLRAEDHAVTLTPHKRRDLKAVDANFFRRVWDCSTERDALVVATCDKDHPPRIEESCIYSYIGGGVPFQPPFAYGYVCRYMPLDIAQSLMATCLFFAGSKPEKRMFMYRVPNTMTLTIKKQEIDEKIDSMFDAVSLKLASLESRYTVDNIDLCSRSSSSTSWTVNHAVTPTDEPSREQPSTDHAFFDYDALPLADWGQED